MKWLGDGSYDYEVVGESYHQDELEKIVGGKSEDSAEFYVTALLVPEFDNSHDENAVAVIIGGLVVAHLNRNEAREYRNLLQSMGHANHKIECDSVIVGGWERPEQSGHFGVKLDIAEPMKLLVEEKSASKEWSSFFDNEIDIAARASTAREKNETYSKFLSGILILFVLILAVWFG